MTRLTRISITLALAFISYIPSTISAAEVDWSKVESKTFKVFYPGQASWEFLRSENHGRGASVVKKMNKTCADCHVGKDGGYDIRADEIISGNKQQSESKQPFEPEPIPGAPGFKDVTIQAAYDAQNIYLRFQWPGSGASVSDPSLATDDKADRIALQLSNNIGSFKNYGCYITCHDDENGMPENRGTEVTLYGYYTRGKEGSVRDQASLDGFLSKGQFIDLIEAGFAGKEVIVKDMYVLDKRSEDNNDFTAAGGYENGTYTVVITRKLSTGDGKDIVISDGASFTLGVAIHDNKNQGRKHYTAFPLSIGLSTPADINALKF